MKHQILILFTAVLSTAASAQEVVSSGGDSFEGSGVMLDFTLGELATETIDGQAILTQGFHQTQLAIVAVKELESIAFRVYPNPTANSLTFDFKDVEDVEIIHILDLSGRTILSVQRPQGPRVEMDLSHLSKGAYLAQIISKQSSNSSSILIQKL